MRSPDAQFPFVLEISCVFLYSFPFPLSPFTFPLALPFTPPPHPQNSVLLTFYPPGVGQIAGVFLCFRVFGRGLVWVVFPLSARSETMRACINLVWALFPPPPRPLPPFWTQFSPGKSLLTFHVLSWRRKPESFFFPPSPVGTFLLFPTASVTFGRPPGYPGWFQSLVFCPFQNPPEGACSALFFFFFFF